MPSGRFKQNVLRMADDFGRFRRAYPLGAVGGEAAAAEILVEARRQPRAGALDHRPDAANDDTHCGWHLYKDTAAMVVTVNLQVWPCHIPNSL